MLTHTPYVSDTDVSKLERSIFLSFAPTLAFLDLYLFLCLEVALYNKVFKWSADVWDPERMDMAVHFAETTQVFRSLLPSPQEYCRHAPLQAHSSYKDTFGLYKLLTPLIRSILTVSILIFK